MTQLTENLFAVEVPDNMNAFKVECMPEIDLYELDCYELGEYDEPVKEKSISLPAGTWQLLCTTKEASEEQARGIVLKMDMGFKDVFMNYATGSFDYDTGAESLNSLLTSKGLDGNKNYCLLKKMN